MSHLMFATDGLNVLHFKCLISVTKLLYDISLKN